MSEAIIDTAFLALAVFISMLVGIALGASAASTYSADRALCESRGGVYLTAPVEPGCYRIEEVGDGE